MLGINPDTYKAIECGNILMTPKLAKQLGKLLDVNPQFLYDAALQLDCLLIKAVMIRILKAKIDQMNAATPVQQTDK